MKSDECAFDQPEDLDVAVASLRLLPVPLPDFLEESSVIDKTELAEASTVVESTEFTLVPRGTTRGKDMLVEAPGYYYTVRKETKTTRFWWCGARQQGHRCPASVSERGGMFIRGAHSHKHTADRGCLLNKQLSRKVKDTAYGNVFQSAMVVVKELLQDVPMTSTDNLPQPDQLVRKANRFRQNQRPSDPHAMDHELATGHIPESFLQKVITVDGARHLVFSTQHQLELLAQAKTWYVDDTFKVSRTADVLDQLIGIHAFIKKDDSTERVPLVFVLMSRRRKKDYKKVMKKIKTLLPTSPNVETFVLDFEVAVWQAITAVFPDTHIRGCAFHWTQAVWKKLQACGLAAVYNAGGGVQQMLRRLLALPLLPAEHIPVVFKDLQRAATDNERLVEVFTYIKDTWIDGALWKPEDWSVYAHPVSTNNDCEG